MFEQGGMSMSIPEAQIRLWRLLGILTVAVTVFFTILTGVTATPADLGFFAAALFALAAPPGLMLGCLYTGRLRLAGYSSIPGVLISAGAGVWVLFAFLATQAGISGILSYPVGIALALPCGYASALQFRVAATVCIRKRKHPLALDVGGTWHLTP